MRKISILGLVSLGLGLVILCHVYQGTFYNFLQKAIVSRGIAACPVKKQYVDPITLSKEAYLVWLKQEECNAWGKLEDAFKVSRTDIEKMKLTSTHEYAQLIGSLIASESDGKEVSQENKEFIKEIAREYGMDVQALRIISWMKPISGGSTDSIVFINQNRFNAMPLLVKKFVIAHELAHCINKDHSTDFVLAKLQQMNPPANLQEVQQALQEFAHFKELRADSMAMSLGRDYAEGQTVYMEHQLKMMLNNSVLDSMTHPSDMMRYEVGKQFLVAYAN